MLVIGTWLVSATPDLLFHACLLALSHSGRHESTLCCSVQGRLKAVLLCLRYVLRYYGFRSLVCASWCSGEKLVQKQKLRCLCSLEAMLLVAELMIQLALSPRRAPPQELFSPRSWYSPVPWLGLKRAPVSRTCHTYTSTHARFLLLAVVMVLLLYCGWLVLVMLVLQLPIALSSLLITCNEKTKEEKKNVTKKQRKQGTSGTFFFPNH